MGQRQKWPEKTSAGVLNRKGKDKRNKPLSFARRSGWSTVRRVKPARYIKGLRKITYI